MSAHQPFRLAGGGRVDRSRALDFRFNGRTLTGYAGDTLASALLANGVRVVSRGFKYHRPRGILSAGIEEPNALLRVETAGATIPLVRATVQPLIGGLSARSENCFPAVDFDFGRLLDFTHALWPAGFYLKTFKWPSWHTWEGFIRRTAGLGRLPAGEDPARYYQHNLHCDVLVVGGGPAGLAAALTAARSGARVVLIDQGTELGGSLLGERIAFNGRSAEGWVAEIRAALADAANVRILMRTSVAGYYDHNVLTAHDQSDAQHPKGRVERFWTLRARQVVLAPGAIEQPLVFAHNDRPGIMLASAVRTYVNRYAVAPGRMAVVTTNNDDAYRTAFDLHDAGIGVAAIVDARPEASPFASEGAARRGLSQMYSSVVTGTRGGLQVREVTVQRLTADGSAVQHERHRLQCDLLAMSGGFSPTVHLYSQAGGRLRYDANLAAFLPEQCAQQVGVAGAAAGYFDTADAIASGVRAGREAASRVGHAAGPVLTFPSIEPTTGYGIRPLRRSPAGPTARQWIDFQHDVTAADIELAVRENYSSVEHLKRYTTTGMAIDQGKTSNLNALALLADLTGRAIPEVGTTTFRPQFAPVTMGAIGGGNQGDLYLPPRQLPAHLWHTTHGAELEDYGGWKRPAVYRCGAESRAAAIAREVRTVREQVGLFDASPLGKIEVRGPDAAQFLDRIYLNTMQTLASGRVRYGLMLNQNGIVIDDGICARLAPDHFLVSTTAANGDRIAAWLEDWHQCEWPDLDLIMLPVTSQWAVLTLAGPQARQLIQRLDGDIDFSAAAFPHMALREGRLNGCAARVQRVSFSGELSFEVGIPADGAFVLWQRLMELGADLGIAPVGIEAWLELRLEKGFLHVGTDTDGTTNAYDVGFGAVLEKKAGDFIGRRSLLREHDRREDRRQFVGLEAVDTHDPLVTGAHIVTGAGPQRRSAGFVTSACVSSSVGKAIGLGLLERGRSRKGEKVTVFDQGRTVMARVVDPAFYDPSGERMHA